MDLLRQLVGGPKMRFRKDGFNLDLTYISPRVIAMAFPASGIQKLYRNSIDAIAELLQTHHNNKYLTINISGRKIDEAVLQNVVSYDWEDHKAPSFDTLFIICEQAAYYLSGDPERIVVFHCNHGKGRTGTIICCFFLFMGIFKDYRSVMHYYGKMRFDRQDYGVTQPCQIEYIRYFQRQLRKQTEPQVLRIKKVTFKGGFHFDDPYLKIVGKNRNTIYNTHSLDSSLVIEKNQEYSIVFKQTHSFTGDITLELKQNKVIGRNLLISYTFNTAFMGCSQPREVQLIEMSPKGSQGKNNFQKDFMMEIEFRKVCNCGEERRMEGCQKCKGILKEEFKRWDRIHTTEHNRKKLLAMAEEICFGVEASPKI